MDRSIHNNSAITVVNGRKQIVGIVRQPPKCTRQNSLGDPVKFCLETAARVIMDRTTSLGTLKSRSYISHSTRTGQVFNEQNS